MFFFLRSSLIFVVNLLVMFWFFPWQIMRVVSEKLEAENSWVLEKQQVYRCSVCVTSSINTINIIFLYYSQRL